MKMTVQRFLNRILYSYSWLDRLVYSNPINPQGREYANNVGLTTLTFVFAGYTLGGLNVIKIIAMGLFQMTWLESKYWLVAFTCLLLPFELSFVKEGPKHDSAKGLIGGKSDSIKWDIIAFLLFVGSAWIGLYVIMS